MANPNELRAEIRELEAQTTADGARLKGELRVLRQDNARLTVAVQQLQDQVLPFVRRSDGLVRMLQRLLAERCVARLGLPSTPGDTAEHICEVALQRARSGELDPVTRDLVGELMDQHGMVSFWRQLPAESNRNL
jgi:cell division protein FtsB